jgi:prepilin-type N-terminal cleavage/methylation domain-containing protein
MMIFKKTTRYQKMNRENNKNRNQAGFTLIELLIAMVVSGMIVGGTVAIFQTMVRDHNTQVKILAMQQNLRATMGYLERYIRMAGYDPTGLADAGFTTMLSNNVAFTSDLDSSGITTDADWEENLEFKLEDDVLKRTDMGGSDRTLAENIEVFNVVYLDKDGVPTSAADDVSSLQVTLVGRFKGGGFLVDYTDNQVYRNQQGAVILPAQNDKIRRMLLTADISCRNMGW